MSRNVTERRTFVAAGTAALLSAALQPNEALAQVQGAPIALRPQDVGALHTERMVETRTLLNGQSPLERDGLRKLADFLRQREVIPQLAHDLLYELIDRVLTSKTVDTLRQVIGEFFAKIGDNAHALLLAISNVVRSSVDFVREYPKEQWEKVLKVVVGDLSGALSGAGTGSKWGTAGSVVGAAIGAASGSITAAYAK